MFDVEMELVETEEGVYITPDGREVYETKLDGLKFDPSDVYAF